jgi:hypothetical protein
MNLGWKLLIEVGFVWAMMIAVLEVTRDPGDGFWDVAPIAVGSLLGAAMILGVLYLFIPNRDEVEEIR